MIDVVIPTYKRPEKLERTIRSIRSEPDLRIRVFFDNNDTESVAACSDLLESRKDVEAVVLQKQYNAFGIWNVYSKDMPPEVEAFFYVCDDIEFLSDCIPKAVDAVRSLNGDGVVGLNQVNVKSDAGEGRSTSAMGLIGRVFAERFPSRCCFCPDYRVFQADGELGIYARKVRRFHYEKDAKIIHYHPSHCSEPPDQTHREVRKKKVAFRDLSTFKTRQRNGWLWGREFKTVFERKEES